MSTTAILSAGGIALALVAIWKIFVPLAELTSLMRKGVPMWEEQIAFFTAAPNNQRVLNQIAEQFKTNSGSHLKDQTDRLEALMENLKAVVEQIRIGLEAQKQIMDQDRTLTRHQYQQTIVSFDHLTTTMLEVQKEQAKVAIALAVAQVKVEGVANDLAESHARADRVQGQPGEAADAASQQTTAEKDQDNRR